ncbi:UPF0496 protein [Apostasia shenzhenica]|uniref:UPF0496 protein n=1 Tax=Apostasia shenzhenica TaxID=1088818 RepID=A0A2I0AXW4_9ASPA|nr:UPF0496 protein [Apostasia shenzhenica]
MPPPSEKGEGQGKERVSWKRRAASPASSSGAQISSGSTAASPSGATINLQREYSLAVQTNSYNEIWARMHHRHGHRGEEEEEETQGLDVLRPDRSSIEDALRSAPPTYLTRLISRYLDSSERASDLFVALRRSVDLAREIYDPVSNLLDILPVSSPVPSLSLSQCDRAFDVFLDFDSRENPFPSSDDARRAFDDIRDCFALLKQQLDLRVLRSRRRHRLLRRATASSAACLVVSAAGAAATALVLASHALLALAVAPCFCSGDLLAGSRRRLRERMAETDAAARETYVLDNNLNTVERLVARLHATVESDKVLLRMGMERGRAQRHPIQEVVRQLRKNHLSFRNQLTDLEEHVCLCLAALNRARYLLLRQIVGLGSAG